MSMIKKIAEQQEQIDANWRKINKIIAETKTLPQIYKRLDLAKEFLALRIQHDFPGYVRINLSTLLDNMTPKEVVDLYMTTGTLIWKDKGRKEAGFQRVPVEEAFEEYCKRFEV